MRRPLEDRLQCIADTSTGGRTLTSPTLRRDNSDSGSNAKAILLAGLCFCRFASRQTKSDWGSCRQRSKHASSRPSKEHGFGRDPLLWDTLGLSPAMGTKWAERWSQAPPARCHSLQSLHGTRPFSFQILKLRLSGKPTAAGMTLTWRPMPGCSGLDPVDRQSMQQHMRDGRIACVWLGPRQLRHRDRWTWRRTPAAQAVRVQSWIL